MVRHRERGTRYGSKSTAVSAARRRSQFPPPVFTCGSRSTAVSAARRRSQFPQPVLPSFTAVPRKFGFAVRPPPVLPLFTPATAASKVVPRAVDGGVPQWRMEAMVGKHSGSSGHWKASIALVKSCRIATIKTRLRSCGKKQLRVKMALQLLRKCCGYIRSAHIRLTQIRRACAPAK